MSSNTLIISPKVFKERTPAHTNTDDKLILPIIKIVQDMRMNDLLGSALLAKIQTDIAAATAGNYLTFRNNYLIDAMIWLVMAEMPDTLQYQYFNSGVNTIQTDKTQIVDRVKVDQLKSKYLGYAEYYIKRAMAYLRQNATASFLPEYLAVISTLDAIAPTNTAYTCPIYLGDESNAPYDSYSTRRRDANKGNVNLNYQINNDV